MRTPDSLIALVDHGIIESVQRPLMSGKEAHIYLVESGGEPRVAKIYKAAQDRSFQNRADYIEGRKVRNSRDQRAMGNRSKHGRAQNEAAWKSAEVDMIYRLRDAGVRVPTPFNFIDGVLIMELVTDAEGFPAPRLGDLTFEPPQATEVFHKLLGEVVRMLCAGVVHGDLSDFNVLMDAEGPVIIDFPQAVDASSNANARKLLLRDVENLQRFHAKFVPDAEAKPYAEEMWDLYSRNALTPDTRLTGKFRTKQRAVSTAAVLDLIADAERDERRRREGLRLSMRGVGGAQADAERAEPLGTARGAEDTRSVPPSRAMPRAEPTPRATRAMFHEPRQAQKPGVGAAREARGAGRDAQMPHEERPSLRWRKTSSSEQAPRDERPSFQARKAPRQEQAAPQGPRHEQTSRGERASLEARKAPRQEQAPHAERSTVHEKPVQRSRAARGSTTEQLRSDGRRGRFR